MSKLKITPPIKELSELIDDFKVIKQQPLKQQIKTLRTWRFDLKNSYKKGNHSLMEIEGYLELIRNDPDHESYLYTAISKDWLKLTGNDKVTVLKKKNLKVDVKSATLALFDKQFTKDLSQQISQNNFDEAHLTQLINDGKGYFWGIGSDGSVDCQYRMVNAIEPMVSLKEFRFCRNISPTIVIQAPSGRLVIDCLSGVFKENDNFFQVPPGNYKVKIFEFYMPNKIHSFYCVITDSDEEARNQTKFMILDNDGDQ